MSQYSKMRQSREQWKAKAIKRGQGERYQRKQSARHKASAEQKTKALEAAHARIGQLEAQLHDITTRPKVEVVHLALQLFLEVRIGFRAVSRVLTLLAVALGIKRAPCPQTVINWVTRLAIVRIDAARHLRGLPLPKAPFSNGLIWMIDISIGLGTGKILAVLAVDAHHHQRHRGALGLAQVHCLGVSVAASWTGETVAEVLKRLIAVMGRPVAYLKDRGSELSKAVDLLAQEHLASASIDDISHAAASMLKRTYQHHPDFEAFLSACGRVSGHFKQTILACLAPPKVRTKARFMNVHRLFSWADRVLKLSPAGGAKAGSVLARLRANLDDLPSCKALIKRFRADAKGLMGCEQLLKTKGLTPDTLAACEPLIDTIASAAVRQEFRAYLALQLETAKELGLDQIGLPMSSDSIESLFGVAKQHGVGQTQDAARIALRLPALCGAPTREEAKEVLDVSVARQKEVTDQLISLTQQRRQVLAYPERLESLSEDQGHRQVELIPSPKSRSNDESIISLSTSCKNGYGPHGVAEEDLALLENTGPPEMREAVLS